MLLNNENHISLSLLESIIIHQLRMNTRWCVEGNMNVCTSTEQKYLWIFSGSHRDNIFTHCYATDTSEKICIFFLKLPMLKICQIYRIIYCKNVVHFSWNFICKVFNLFYNVFKLFLKYCIFVWDLTIFLDYSTSERNGTARKYYLNMHTLSLWVQLIVMMGVNVPFKMITRVNTIKCLVPAWECDRCTQCISGVCDFIL